MKEIETPIDPWEIINSKNGLKFCISTDQKRFKHLTLLFLKLFETQKHIQTKKRELNIAKRAQIKLATQAWNEAEKTLGINLKKERYSSERLDDTHVLLACEGEKDAENIIK